MCQRTRRFSQKAPASIYWCVVEVVCGVGPRAACRRRLQQAFVVCVWLKVFWEWLEWVGGRRLDAGCMARGGWCKAAGAVIFEGRRGGGRVLGQAEAAGAVRPAPCVCYSLRVSFILCVCASGGSQWEGWVASCTERVGAAAAAS